MAPLFCLYFREAKQIGSWNTDSGLEIEDDQSYDVTGHETPRLMVVTIEEPPYVMTKCQNCSGNDKYEGFAIDLLNSISKVAKFDFHIYTVPDGLYGVFDHDTSEWNGIVKELINRKADIAVAPMTINFARLENNIMLQIALPMITM